MGECLSDTDTGTRLESGDESARQRSSRHTERVWRNCTTTSSNACKIMMSECKRKSQLLPMFRLYTVFDKRLGKDQADTLSDEPFVVPKSSVYSNLPTRSADYKTGSTNASMTSSKRSCPQHGNFRLLWTVEWRSCPLNQR